MARRVLSAVPALWTKEQRPAKRARTSDSADGNRLDDGSRQQRVEMLEELFGVHGAQSLSLVFVIRTLSRMNKLSL
jgi:hypothetical protein